jgi:DNA-binding NtrC family response regulator
VPSRLPTVLVVDDDAAFRTSLAAELTESGYGVTAVADGAAARAAVSREEPDVVLLDLRLPEEDGLSILEWIKAQGSAEVIVLTGHGSVSSAIQAMRQGAADYLSKPCDLDELDLALERALESRRLRERTQVLEVGLAGPESEVVGRSPPFLALLDDVARTAQSRLNVLIRGESGTGKELVARRLHQLSPRRRKPFVVVDAAGLAEQLMVSELFGHEKGAFTGATERKHGLFEVADGGTLFLDEIGEVAPSVQVKLLRVLDTGAFRRLGGTREVRVDVRVVSATNRSLEAEVAAGAFREDLYYRLSLLTLAVPPLRERPEDIAPLAEHFLARAARSHGRSPRLEPSALEALAALGWPGNVRELSGVIEQLVVLHRGESISGADVRALPRMRPIPRTPVDEDGLTLAELERRHVERILRACHGHRTEAARRLGISERTLYRMLKDGDL